MKTMIAATLLMCILITLIEVLMVKVNPISGLYNLPKDIQERVRLLPRYKGMQRKILPARERITRMIPVLAVLLVVFAGIVYRAGARSFLQGFFYTFAMCTVVKLYVTLVLICGWYAHTSAVWIPGTKDMKESYQNYSFYLSSIPKSLLAGAVAGVLIGAVIALA